jgi:hypothetical protein
MILPHWRKRCNLLQNSAGPARGSQAMPVPEPRCDRLTSFLFIQDIGPAFCDPASMANRTITHSTVIPGMHYRNAADAIEWLCRVFGFEKHAVYTGPGNTIMHAELTLGSGMIMLGSVNEKMPERHMKLPAEVGGARKPAG